MTHEVRASGERARVSDGEVAFWGSPGNRKRYRIRVKGRKKAGLN